MKDKQPYVVVVGGLTKDIGGIPREELIRGDSNIGRVNTTLGGVGRNIAHNLALLGVPVKMLTAIGKDDFAEGASKRCEKDGIDLSHALEVDGYSTATYLYVADKQGDMDVAISDMEIFENITVDYIKSKEDVILGAAVLVMDTNIPKETIDYIRKNFKMPIFVDPVSIAKAEKLIGSLEGIYALKPNKIEAEFLTGLELDTPASMRAAAEKFFERGLKEVFISLGSKGIYACRGDEEVMESCMPVKLANATGGGDAFMAGIIKGFLDKRALRQQIKFALATSAMAVESAGTINREITAEKVLKRAQL